ncbi:hypothetical protein BH24ACT23_BH24ACT23_08420 [soil metagenome]
MPGRRTLSGLVVLGILFATAVFAFFAYQGARDSAQRENNEAAGQAALAVKQNVTVVAASLRGGSAVVSPSGVVKGPQFRRFARSAIARTGFLGLAWAPLINPGERTRFERKFSEITEFTPDGRLERQGTVTNRRLLPLALTFPQTQARKRALGFDLYSDPARTETVRAAIRGGDARLTPPLRLAQTKEPGAVLYAPVAVRAESGRRVVGVFTSAVSGDTIAAELRQQIDAIGAVEISDAGEPLGFERVESAASAEVGVFGRRWVVSVEETESASPAPAIAVGASGFTLALVAAGVFFVASRRERDLTRRQRQTELQSARESLLVRITEGIEREIEVDARLRTLARTLVPAVGDLCVVHEVTAEGVVRRVGVAAIEERIESLIEGLPDPPPLTSPIHAAIVSRQPVLYTRISENREARRARERGIPVASDERELSPQQQIERERRSSLMVPLVARGKVLGTLSLGILNTSGRAPLTRDDVAFGTEVATHAAMALDNARLYEQQRDIAAILQQALLPRSLPEIQGVDVAVRHRPGKAGTEVGGDFYDLFEVGGRWMAVVGDVCGKGPEAAALTALVRHTLRATAQLGPETAVRRVHEAIVASDENTYCTLCCAELRTAPSGLVARVATAGHPEPRVIDPDGTVRRLEVTGPLVGVLERPIFGSQEVELGPGAMFFMCSDGVPEARRNGEVFGDDRLESLLASLVGLKPEAALERMEREVVGFVQGRQRDDLALFALRVRDKRS